MTCVGVSCGDLFYVATKRGSGACILPRQPRSGKDHDLWRLILCEALHQLPGTDRRLV